MAAELGQAATQAPQPIQAAASMAFSADARSTAILLASCAWPVLTDVAKTSSCNNAVERGAVHRQIFYHRKGFGSPGFHANGVAIFKRAHV